MYNCSLLGGYFGILIRAQIFFTFNAKKKKCTSLIFYLDSVNIIISIINNNGKKKNWLDISFNLSVYNKMKSYWFVIIASFYYYYYYYNKIIINIQ